MVSHLRTIVTSTRQCQLTYDNIRILCFITLEVRACTPRRACLRFSMKLKHCPPIFERKKTRANKSTWKRSKVKRLSNLLDRSMALAKMTRNCRRRFQLYTSTAILSTQIKQSKAVIAARTNAVAAWHVASTQIGSYIIRGNARTMQAKMAGPLYLGICST